MKTIKHAPILECVQQRWHDQKRSAEMRNQKDEATETKTPAHDIGQLCIRATHFPAQKQKQGWVYPADQRTPVCNEID